MNAPSEVATQASGIRYQGGMPEGIAQSRVDRGRRGPAEASGLRPQASVDMRKGIAQIREDRMSVVRGPPRCRGYGNALPNGGPFSFVPVRE